MRLIFPSISNIFVVRQSFSVSEISLPIYWPCDTIFLICSLLRELTLRCQVIVDLPKASGERHQIVLGPRKRVFESIFSLPLRYENDVLQGWQTCSHCYRILSKCIWGIVTSLIFIVAWLSIIYMWRTYAIDWQKDRKRTVKHHVHVWRILRQEVHWWSSWLLWICGIVIITDRRWSSLKW